MTRLVMRLLGGYRVELNGRLVYGFETDKARALLAYLMVEADRPHRRETLASLLWPDRPDTVARANLRQALASVRRALGDPASRDDGEPPFLLATPTDVQFNTASDYGVDVAVLEAFARSSFGSHGTGGTPSGGPQAQLLPAALCADFLSGFSVPDSEAFEAWMLNKQEYFHRLALEILDEQNGLFEAAGDYEQAVSAARLQLEMEPWLEEAHRRCMHGLALAGRRDEALHQYEACCHALAHELGVEPAASTRELYAEIRSGGLGRGGRKQAPEEAASLTPALAAKSAAGQLQRPVGQADRSALHARRVILVAREEQQRRLRCHLENALAGDTGVVFVSGDAGSGKTALLEAFGAAAMAEHDDLIVAAARCNPGGHLDAFAPLRRLAEMLFGDINNDLVWRLPGQEQVSRLQRASASLLAALGEQGLDLIDTLVAGASLARRAGASSDRALVAQPAWRPRVAASVPAKAESAVPSFSSGPAPLAQGVLIDALIRTLALIAREQPLLLLLDDLHWVDDATVALLLRLGRELKGSPILVAGAYRSATVNLGREDPKSGGTTRHPVAVAVNELRRIKGEILVDLNRADGRAFVEALVDAEPNRLGARFRDALYAHTGGHALFTVELLRTLEERGELCRDEAGRWIAREPVDWGALPARVEAAIAERIARVPECCRRVLSVASVQGDDFAGEVVAEVTGLPEPEVLACLSGTLTRQHQLVRPEGLQRLGSRHYSVYRFSHHLFQKYLYGQLDPLERARWHGAIAAILDRQIGDNAGERLGQSAQLAWHYEAARQLLPAARALHDAGRQALRVGALHEALDLFEHGVTLLADEPPSPERTQIERLLRVDRLAPQATLNGMGSAQLAGAFARVADAEAGETEGRSRLLLLEADVNLLASSGQLEQALVAAGRMLEEAGQMGDQTFAALAHFWTGFIHHLQGELQEADRGFECAIALLTLERTADLRAATGFDLTSIVLAFSSLNWWIQGYPERAFARHRQALAGAVGQGELFGQGLASALGCMALFLLRSGTAAVQELAARSHEVCLRAGFTWWQDYVEVFLGWLSVMRRGAASDGGIERMLIAIAGWQAKGGAMGADGLLLLLADACLAAARRHQPDDHEERARLLGTALAAMEAFLGPGAPAVWTFQAELRRVQGEVLLESDGLSAAPEASVCFERGLLLAREQGALSWELRAAMSLLQLRLRQGDEYGAGVRSARRTLREVYERFTEGFDLPDLREAAALLDQAAVAPYQCA